MKSDEPVCRCCSCRSAVLGQWGSWAAHMRVHTRVSGARAVFYKQVLFLREALLAFKEKLPFCGWYQIVMLDTRNAKTWAWSTEAPWGEFGYQSSFIPVVSKLSLLWFDSEIYKKEKCVLSLFIFSFLAESFWWFNGKFRYYFFFLGCHISILQYTLQ